MRTVLARAAVLAAALLVVLPMAASAEVDDYAAEATTTAVSLSVFEGAVGSPILELINTDALAASDPMASGSVQAIEVLGNELIPVRQADSTGEPVRDPAEGDGCVVPVAAQGLTLNAVCAVAAADAGGPGEVSASATTQLLEVDVNGSLVGALLTQPLTDALNALTDQIADGATAQAIALYRDACNTLLENLPDEFNEVPNTINDLIGQAPEESQPLTDLLTAVTDEYGPENACQAVIDLSLNDVVAPVIDTQPVADALAGHNLLQIAVDGASSDITGGDESVDAAATQALARVTGPALSVLDDALVALLEGLEAGLVTTIEDITGVPLTGEVDISGTVADVVSQIPLFGIDEPLLEATVSGGAATATLERSDASTTSGGTEPFVRLTIAGGVMELFGQDPESGTFELAAGESTGPIAEGTPLESSISVGELTTDDAAEFEGLPGSTARASATTVDLFNGEEVQGGIELVLAESTAGAYGTAPAVAAPDPDPMPNTGGGAAVAAVLALGAALALRRGRD